MSATLGSLYDALMFFLIVTPLAIVFVGVSLFWHGRDRGQDRGRFLPPTHPVFRETWREK